jgi:sugar-specific transcriptional regulator TrmB
VRLAGRPARYRAADPRALLAQLAAEQGDALDRLSRGLREASEPMEPDTRSVSGARALANVILQLVARAERGVEGVLAAELVRPTLPAWRRARERATLALRVAGEVPAEAQALGAGHAPPETPTLLLIDGTHVVLAQGSGEAVAGIWSSHPALAALVRLALGGLGGVGAAGAPGQAP